MPSNFFSKASEPQKTMQNDLSVIKKIIDRCHSSNIVFTTFTKEKLDFPIADHSLEVFQNDILSSLNNKITLFVTQQLKFKIHLTYGRTFQLAQAMMSLIFNNLSYFFNSLQLSVLQQLFDNMEDAVIDGVPNVHDLLCGFFYEMNPLMYSVVITMFENSLFQEPSTFEKILIILPLEKFILFMRLVKPILLSKPQIFNPAKTSIICRYEELSFRLCDQKRKYLYDILKSQFLPLVNSYEYAIYLQNLSIDERPLAFFLIKSSMIRTVSDFENILMHHEEPVRQLVYENLGVKKLQSLVLNVQSGYSNDIPHNNAVLDFLLTYTPRSVIYRSQWKEVEKLNHDVQSKSMHPDAPFPISESLAEFTQGLYKIRVQAGHLGRVLKYIPLQHYLEFCSHPGILRLITFDITFFWIIMTPLSESQRAIIYDLVKADLPQLTRVRCHNSSYEFDLMRSVLTPHQAEDLQERSLTTQGSYYCNLSFDKSEQDSCLDHFDLPLFEFAMLQLQESESESESLSDKASYCF